MKTNEIHIRDPFVLRDNGKYYMYGTAGSAAWQGAAGFPCYWSENLEDWEGPVVALQVPADFWANENFWAPEVHKYKGRYYLFATYYNKNATRRSQIFASDRPEGPFTLWSEPITPLDWMSLDATFYVEEDGTPWAIFCHEWLQIGTGEICAVKLSDNLKCAIGEPVTLFAASEAPWVLAMDEAPRNGKPCMVTDGPFIVKHSSGSLLLFWSSMSAGGYAEGMAVSRTGKITGPWEQLAEPLFAENGGHGMLFRDETGSLYFTLHAPNTSPLERPVFFPVEETEEAYRVVL